MLPDGAMVRVVELDLPVYEGLAAVLRAEETSEADKGYGLTHSRTLYVSTPSGFRKLIFTPKKVVVDSPGVANSQNDSN